MKTSNYRFEAKIMGALGIMADMEDVSGHEASNCDGVITSDVNR